MAFWGLTTDLGTCRGCALAGRPALQPSGRRAVTELSRHSLPPAPARGRPRARPTLSSTSPHPPAARMLSGLSEGGSSGLWVPGWQLLPWKPVFPT